MSKPITKAVILAAGWGTRLLPATKSLAKPILHIVDRPAIDYLVRDLIDAGIKDIIIVGKQHFDQIENYFDRNLELENILTSENKTDYLKAITPFSDVHFTFVRQAQMGGPGDAVMAAHHLIKDEEAFIVYYADDIAFPHTCVKSMLAQYQKHPGAYVAVKEMPLEKIHHYGVIDIESTVEERLFKIKGLVEKPKAADAPSTFANMTPNIVTRAVVDILANRPKLNQKDHSILAPAIGEAAQNHPVYAYNAEEEWIETGNKLGLLKAQILFGLADPTIGTELKEFLQNTLSQD